MKVIIKRDVVNRAPALNSDAGYLVLYHLTPKGNAIVRKGETVIASMSSYLYGPYGDKEGEVLVRTPRWWGEGPSKRQWQALWRETIVEAVLAKERAARK